MLPLSDTTPRSKFPFFNYLIIVITIYVFYLQMVSSDFEMFVLKWGFVPSSFNPLDVSTYLSVVTSIFLHGDILHIVSNLWFLRIFGDNVENALGHFQYVIFYLVGGIVSVMAQYVFMGNVSIPLIGASGAISAVSGAYYVYFKDSHVKTLVTYFYMIDIVQIPVWLFLGYWFFIQVVSGIGSLGDAAGGGVAFFAHIGGFIFGYLYARAIKRD